MPELSLSDEEVRAIAKLIAVVKDVGQDRPLDLAEKLRLTTELLETARQCGRGQGDVPIGNIYEAWLIQDAKRLFYK